MMEEDFQLDESPSWPQGEMVPLKLLLNEFMLTLTTLTYLVGIVRVEPLLPVKREHLPSFYRIDGYLFVQRK